MCTNLTFYEFLGTFFGVNLHKKNASDNIFSLKIKGRGLRYRRRQWK